MLVNAQQLEFSSYEGLYHNLIPKDHFLREFNELVDFSFIYDELREKYCLDNGRMAVSPILLFKYLLLKVLYNMSDADLVERSRYDMSFKYFLGLRPEDDVIHSTTLTKFRKLRLADENLLDMLIAKSVQIAIDKGVLKSNRIIVDATHTKARYNQKSAYAQLLEQAKLLRKTVYKTASPDWKKKFPKKVENDRVDVDTVIGDTAYSGKKNLELAESAGSPEKSFELISKLNPVISDSTHAEGEGGFHYNKDADMFVCPEGHMAIRKARTGRKNVNKNQITTYYFDIEKCKNCPQCGTCYKPGAKSKTYSVRIMCDQHKRQKEFQETEYFKELASLRYMIEAKNSEIKHRHGYDVASSSGLRGMEIQGATTLFVANMKRIIKLMNE